MNDPDPPSSPLDALSDEEYDRRVAEMVVPLMDRIDEAIVSEDPEEGELRYAAAPAALRNMLAQLIAEECVDQPRPYRLVKEMVRDLDLEGMALAALKHLQAVLADQSD